MLAEQALNQEKKETSALANLAHCFHGYCATLYIRPQKTLPIVLQLTLSYIACIKHLSLSEK